MDLPVLLTDREPSEIQSTPAVPDIASALAEYDELFHAEHKNHLANLAAEEKRHIETIDMLFKHLHDSFQKLNENT
jgi:hypothetical protein